jgi:hypothetical protein
MALWSTRVAPEQPTGLTLQASWGREMWPRRALPAVTIVLRHILPDPIARRYFVAHGLPQGDDLAKYSGVWASDDREFFTNPKLQPVRSWIAERGPSVYLRWLATHPWTRAPRCAYHLWLAATAQGFEPYMPIGWLDGLSIVTNRLIVALLVLAFPFVVRRTRGQPMATLAVVLVGAGVVGGAAAYYSVAFEPMRHCYGAGQQIVVGLVIAALVWLDDYAARRWPVWSAT